MKTWIVLPYWACPIVGIFHATLTVVVISLFGELTGLWLTGWAGLALLFGGICAQVERNARRERERRERLSLRRM